MKFAADTLYVTDLDGTLLDNSQKIPDEAKQLLNEMLDAGLNFSIATARSWASTKPLVEGLRLRHPIVLYNGAHILDPVSGQLIENCTLSAEQMRQVVSLCRKHNVSPRVEGMIEGKPRVSWIDGWEDEGLSLYLESRRHQPRMRPVQEEEELYVGELFQTAFYGRYDALKALYEDCCKLEYLYVGFIQDTYELDFWWLTCCRKDATKAQGVNKLRRLTGIPRIVCFGDNTNDLPMFEVADEAYATANGKDVVKAAATGAIGSNEELGVPRFIASQGKE